MGCLELKEAGRFILWVTLQAYISRFSLTEAMLLASLSYQYQPKASENESTYGIQSQDSVIPTLPRKFLREPSIRLFFRFPAIAARRNELLYSGCFAFVSSEGLAVNEWRVDENNAVE